MKDTSSNASLLHAEYRQGSGASSAKGASSTLQMFSLVLDPGSYLLTARSVLNLSENYGFARELHCKRPAPTR